MPGENQLHVAAGWQPVMRELGLDAPGVFTHPLIRPWRTLPDRQNCTLDAQAGGERIRLHVKRYARTGRPRTAAQEEFAGHQLLVSNGIPTAPLVAWGVLDDRRSFVIFEDLAGHVPADKLMQSSAAFDGLLQPTADLAAKLHDAGLHHRDLYLCHFLAENNPTFHAGSSAAPMNVRLIDPARVRAMPNFLTRGRWLVKDLSQFWYSTLSLPITDAQRTAWLRRYSDQRQLPSPAMLRGKIERKIRGIARHDARLNRLQPARNVSIPW
ncbi:MAG TPA: lipopolysaccharide kinase InaA family protein [Tepidisphaeraceae bacterium]|nr:lipopolysaccharide kinase InaA family protein [Tepidisphaeraceae bacterium]